MLGPILLLVAVSFVLGVPLAIAARSLGRRLNALDAPGVKGQVKASPRRVPNTGGIAIFWSVALPLGAALVAINTGAAKMLVELLPGLGVHLDGLREVSGRAWTILACAGVLHAVGLFDDRRPMPAWPKLVVNLAVATAAAWLTDTRLLTALDGPAGGAWLSIGVTVVWLVVITNAFNFLDNMDGLSAGVGAICAAFLLVSALVSPTPQWFVAAALALLLGALLAFLVFNFPFTSRGASIFQGDAGSLVVGFLLAFLSVRITYLPAGVPGASASASLFPAVCTPLVVLAIPLYDFVSVTLIRLSQGKSPFVGDLQHFSHRLTKHGLSRRAAVVVIYGCTLATAIGGVSLPSLNAWQGLLMLVQTGAVLGVLGLYEWAKVPGRGGAVCDPVDHPRPEKDGS